MTFLIDTNVLSEIRRQRDPNVAAWAASVDDLACYVSVVSLGEIRNGIERLRGRDPRQATALEEWLARLAGEFADRVLPIDQASADEWGRLNAVAERKSVDSLLAATARVHGLTVVTRNTADFTGLGVPLLDPWLPQPAG